MAPVSPQLEPDPQLVWDALNGYQKAAALRAAIELDLFTAVAEGAKAVSEIALRCNASSRGIRILCDYLTVSGFLNKDGETYGLAPTSAVFLNRLSPAYLGSMARFLNSPHLTAGFTNLAATVREGTTQLGPTAASAPEFEGWVTFAESMGPMMKGASEFIANELSRNGKTPRRVLDVAAGHGAFGIAIARKVPEAEVVAQDWPNVLAIAERNAHAAGVEGRFKKLPGDVFAVELGEGYDVVLLTNFLHHFDQQTCVRLLKKIYGSMVSGGRLITLEFVPNEDRVSPPIPATFSMMMLGLTPAGDAYTEQQLGGMLRDAGFSGSQFIPVPQSPEHIVISSKGAA